MDVSELKGDMDRQFEGVTRQFEGVARQFQGVARQFEAVDSRFDEVLAFIASESEKTRRHFDIAVDQIKSERNLVATLDDHEVRLSRLERTEES